MQTGFTMVIASHAFSAAVVRPELLVEKLSAATKGLLDIVAPHLAAAEKAEAERRAQAWLAEHQE